ncbi:hypothetical protein [Edaphobacter bradus]|uniref:hypothetical protein n=1 Tax=Edaphobacter bradus TaxID=2259016 RepID=UPI0021E02C92|nr:hypothetical protein [Edaphobacter bradus]
MYKRQLGSKRVTPNVSAVHTVARVVRTRALVGWAVICFLSGAGSAQTNISQTVNATYNNITTGYVIPNDFIGMSFETQSMGSGQFGVSGYFFSSANTQLINLFQQMSIRNLRIGGGTVNLYQPTDQDIDSLFGFAPVAGVKVMYSVPIDNSPGVLGTNNESYDAQMVGYIWGTAAYSPWVHSFALGNEEDANATLSNYVNTYWEPFQGYIANHGGSGASFSGPDSGSYNGVRSYNGTLCGGSPGRVFWAYGFAYCAKNSPWTFFSNTSQHFYAGGGACNSSTTCNTANQATTDMLSSAWVTGTTNTGTEPCGSGSCTYYPYGYLYNNMLSPIVTNTSVPYRLTELNEFVTGTQGASNAFTGALWALDAMHWFAENNAAGTNFHNNPWIPSDTIIPGDLTQYGGAGWQNQNFACTGGVCNNFTIVPKGYGIKAFDLGGHGYTVGVTALETNMPDSGSLDTYAVGSGQDLYVTLINKTNATNSGDTANVTINIGTSDAPFVAASVSSIALWNGDSSAPSDPTQLTASLGNGSIVNSGTQWAGYWTAQSAMTSGSEVISVPPAQAVIVHFHAPSNYVGPVQINQNGALEMFTTDSSGNVYHQWQKAADLNTEPNSAVTNWSSVTEYLSGAQKTASPTGDIAVAKNLDNTLQVFIPTSTDVFYSRQQTPGGAWSSSWTDMGSPTGLSHLKAGRNADGSLTVFGLDSSGNLYYNTENAPGVAWSGWTKLNGQTIGNGYVVGENLNGRLEVFGVSGGNVYHIWQTLSNGWSSWGEIAANSGQTLNGWLQLARNVAGDLYLFALDSNGNVWSNWQSSPSGGWQTSWTELPIPSSAIKPGFVAGQNANGRFELFGVGSDANVYHMWITSSGTWNSNWVTITGNVPAGGFDPHLMVGNTNDGRLQVFAIGKNSPSDIYTNWQASISGSWTNWADFGSATSGLTFFTGQP